MFFCGERLMFSLVSFIFTLDNKKVLLKNVEISVPDVLGFSRIFDKSTFCFFPEFSTFGGALAVPAPYTTAGQNQLANASKKMTVSSKHSLRVNFQRSVARHSRLIKVNEIVRAHPSDNRIRYDFSVGDGCNVLVDCLLSLFRIAKNTIVRIISPKSPSSLTNSAKSQQIESVCLVYDFKQNKNPYKYKIRTAKLQDSPRKLKPKPSSK